MIFDSVLSSRIVELLLWRLGKAVLFILPIVVNQNYTTILVLQDCTLTLTVCSYSCSRSDVRSVLASLAILVAASLV